MGEWFWFQTAKPWERNPWPVFERSAFWYEVPARGGWTASAGLTLSLYRTGL